MGSFCRYCGREAAAPQVTRDTVWVREYIRDTVRLVATHRMLRTDTVWVRVHLPGSGTESPPFPASAGCGERPASRFASTLAGTLSAPAFPAPPSGDSALVAVALPFERRIYATENYRASVTGYKPELESIELFPLTKTVVETRTKIALRSPRWQAGLVAGAGGGMGLAVGSGGNAAQSAGGSATSIAGAGGNVGVGTAPGWGWTAASGSRAGAARSSAETTRSAAASGAAPGGFAVYTARVGYVDCFVGLRVRRNWGALSLEGTLGYDLPARSPCGEVRVGIDLIRK